MIKFDQVSPLHHYHHRYVQSVETGATSTSSPNNHSDLQNLLWSPVASLNVSDGDTTGGGGGDWTSSVEDAFVEGSHLWFLLVAGYSLVFTVGVLGNAMLLAALCGSGNRARGLPIRNHLMVNLAAADLLVTAVCVPITACAAASHACWPSFLVSWMCQLGPLLQRTPVAASTLSLALLSLDRWAALRHPRFAQRFRDKRFILLSMGVIWILAGLVSLPTLWAREWETTSQYWAFTSTAATENATDFSGNSSTLPSMASMFLKDEARGGIEDYAYAYPKPSDWYPAPSGLNSTPGVSSGSTGSSSSSGTGWKSWEWQGVCTEKWTNAGIQLAYTATYLGTAFVSPALIVAACHASVSQKLTAQLHAANETAGGGGGGGNNNNATSGGGGGGETMGPSVKARRPTQVIIVAKDLHSTAIGGGGGGVGQQTNGKLCPPGGAPGAADRTKFYSRKLVPCDPSSDEDDVYLRMQIQADLESFRQISEYQQKRGGSHGARHHGYIKSYGKSGAPGGPIIPGISISSVDNKNNNNSHKIHLKAARRETSIIRAHRRLRKKLTNPWKPPPPLLPTYSSQSFRSRRRAANLLAALAGVFIFCWVPYVVCVVWDMFAYDKSVVRLLIPFALFIGHAHSALNPIVSWRLNRSAFVRFQRRPDCVSCIPKWLCVGSSWCCCCGPCGDCDQASSPSTTRSHTRRPHGHSVAGHSTSVTYRQCCPCFGNCCWRCGRRMRRSSSPEAWNRNASSTNEAALGAFHPKYLNRMPLPDPISRCHTSHFLRA